MKKADLITGIVLLALSGYVIWEAWHMPPSLTFGPGSAFLPFWLGVILAGLALTLLIRAWWRPQDAEDKNLFPGGKKLFSVVKVLAGLMAFTLLMETLGFVFNTLIFVFYLMLTAGRERWPKSVLTAVLTTAGLYVIFQTLLGITLPRNMFGF